LGQEDDEEGQGEEGRVRMDEMEEGKEGRKDED